MTKAEIIRQKLSILNPSYCEIIDDSHKHSDHTNGARDSHFTIKIFADIFAGKSLITQHRIINKLLETELASGVHALSINIKKQ